jgi:hypothetical protein
MNGAIDARGFAIRSIIADESIRVIIFLLLGCMWIGGFCLRIFERPLRTYNGYDFSDYGNAIWAIIVTITTVGYGD